MGFLPEALPALHKFHLVSDDDDEAGPHGNNDDEEDEEEGSEEEEEEEEVGLSYLMKEGIQVRQSAVFCLV